MKKLLVIVLALVIIVAFAATAYAVGDTGPPTGVAVATSSTDSGAPANVAIFVVTLVATAWFLAGGAKSRYVVKISRRQRQGTTEEEEGLTLLNPGDMGATYAQIRNDGGLVFSVAV